MCGQILGICKSLRHMNVEIGTKAAKFPENEFINGIFFAVQIWVNNYVTFSYCFSADVVTDQN
jgi:hypothetical protein